MKGGAAEGLSRVREVEIYTKAGKGLIPCTSHLVLLSNENVT